MLPFRNDTNLLSPTPGAARLSRRGLPSGGFSRNPCFPFALTYMGALVLVNLLGVVTWGPFAFRPYFLSHRGVHDEFFDFWFEASVLGLTLASHLLILNGLLMVYLWVCFLAEGRANMVRRVTFFAAIFVLLNFQLLYLDVASTSPPEFLLREVALGSVVP